MSAKMNRGDEAAFPRAGASYLDDNDVRRYSRPSRGLTVREWFAGMALQGILSVEPHTVVEGVPALVAERAVGYADALVDALAEDSGEEMRRTMMPDPLTLYKAVRLDGTSHYDKATRWEVGVPVRVTDCDPPTSDGCGRGIHASRTLLGAVGFQDGPSEYLAVQVQPEHIIQETEKLRVSECLPTRALTAEEQDALAGFRLWEANHAINPLLVTGDGLPEPELRRLLADWGAVEDSVRGAVWNSVGGAVRDAVWASVGDAVWDSVGDSVWKSVWKSVGHAVEDSVGDAVEDSVGGAVRDSVGSAVWASVRGAVWNSVGDSVEDAVEDAVWDAVWAYIGSLFPNITTWRGTDLEHPWDSLRALWLAGYVPSFDGEVWRLHRGPNAEVVLTVPKEELHA